MLVRHLSNCPEITAIDDTRLREILNLLHDNGDLKIGYSLAHAIVKARKASLPHRIKTSSEVYYVLKGSGIMHVDEETRVVSAGDSVYIPPGSTQYIENSETHDLVFLCIVYPSWRAEDEETV
jgi:mannose-6-phosphate isomerase-like protein (cupin superfamily)